MSSKRPHLSLFPGPPENGRPPVYSRLGYPAPQNGKRRKTAHNRLNGNLPVHSGQGPRELYPVQGPRDARDLITAHRAASPSFYQHHGHGSQVAEYPLNESLLDLNEPPLPYQFRGPGVRNEPLVVDNVETHDRHHRGMQRSVALTTRRFPQDDLRNELINKRRFQDNPQDLRSRLCRMQSERHTPPEEDDLTGPNNYASEPPTLRISIRNEPEMPLGPGPVLSARMQGRLSARQPRLVLTEEDSQLEAEFSDFEPEPLLLPSSVGVGHSHNKRPSEPSSPTSPASPMVSARRSPAPPVASDRRSYLHSRRSDERRFESPPRHRDTRSRGRPSLSRNIRSSPVRGEKNSQRRGEKSRNFASSYSRSSLDRMWRAEKESSRYRTRGNKSRSPFRRSSVERKPRYVSTERRSRSRRRRSPLVVARRQNSPWKSRRSRSRSRSRRFNSPPSRRHRRRSTPSPSARRFRRRTPEIRRSLTRSPAPKSPNRRRKTPSPDQSFHSGASCYDFELLGSQHDEESVSGLITERTFADTSSVRPQEITEEHSEYHKFTPERSDENGDKMAVPVSSSEHAVLSLSTPRRDEMPTGKSNSAKASDLSSSRSVLQRVPLPVPQAVATNGIQKNAPLDGKPTKNSRSSDVIAQNSVTVSDPLGDSREKQMRDAARGQHLLRTAHSPPPESALPPERAVSAKSEESIKLKTNPPGGAVSANSEGQSKPKTNPPAVRFSQLKNRGSLLVVPVMQESVEEVVSAAETTSISTASPSRFAFKKQDRKPTKSNDLLIDARFGNNPSAIPPWVLTSTVRNDCSYVAMPNNVFPENYRMEDPRWLSRQPDFLNGIRDVKEENFDGNRLERKDQADAVSDTDSEIPSKDKSEINGRKKISGVKIEPAE